MGSLSRCPPLRQKNATAGTAACCALVDFRSGPISLAGGRLNHLRRHVPPTGRTTGHGKRTPFDFAVVDEAQDVSVAQLRFLAALGSGKPNGLFFAGDLGQRIFQQPFSWKALGVDIRGRSRTLHINYRTSHQIRTQADRLLGPELSDVDGITEERLGTISVFNGPAPEIRVLKSPDEESQAVSEWLRDRIPRRRAPRNRCIRPLDGELDRARAAVNKAGFRSRCSTKTLKLPAVTFQLYITT